MRIARPLIVAAAVAAVHGSLLPGTEAPPGDADAADLIMTGGEIKTPTGWADALAIRGGVIMAVGGAATINALRGPKTQVLMLSGSAVLPRFVRRPRASLVCRD